jgi:hypothetical protein
MLATAMGSRRPHARRRNEKEKSERPQQRPRPAPQHPPPQAPQVSEIIVSFSGGKDALACLDICARQFSRVAPFFMYWVKGLEFQEATLCAAEARYGLHIERVPHWALSTAFNNLELRNFHPDVPDDDFAYLRRLRRRLDRRGPRPLLRAFPFFFFGSSPMLASYFHCGRQHNKQKRGPGEGIRASGEHSERK